jgi:nitroimidazol reductase NimA-like FMN-containing flavoprotein (pyridoxamine 5'-phosphate oxidase superfamily)
LRKRDCFTASGIIRLCCQADRCHPAGMTAAPPSDFTRLRRKHQRGSYDMATIHAILDAAPLCHVGHIIDGRPVVIPTFHWRHDDRVYWHGSSASRMLQANAAGGEVCLTVSMLDAWVLARTSFNHSANYRSVMCFGIPVLVEDPAAKLAAMKGFVERLFPGRWDRLRPPTAQEVKATSILSMPLTEASAKLRAGPPMDDEADRSWPVWGGLLPVRTVADLPVPDEHVVAGQEPPTTPLAIRAAT